MRRDITLSAIIAVAVHISILSAAIPKASHTEGSIHNPIALSIVHPRKAEVGPLPAEKPAETGLKPHVSPKSQGLPKPTLIPKGKPSQEKPRTARPTIKKSDLKASQLKKVTRLAPEFAPEDKVESVPEPPFSHVPRGPDEKIEDGAPFKAPFIPNHTHQDEDQNTGTPQGYGPTEGMITYATPKYKENPRPLYPNVARKRGYEGRTLLRVEVLASGKVGRIKIATSSGFDVLDQAALASVRDWTFVPGTQNGKNMKQWVMVPIKFSLR
jgi:protein TonB